jgi:YbbR domain-containing protein
MNKNIIRGISVILALIIWFLITNRENPIVTVRFNVPIQILNESVIKERRLHVVEDYINTVEVSARGRKKTLEKVRAEDFQIIVDIYDYAFKGQRSIPLDNLVYKGNENISYWISGKNTLDLNMESIGEKELKIECETEGMPYDGYSVSSIEMVPDKIVLQNLSSYVDRAAMAKVTVNIDRLKSDKTYKEILKIYDEDGHELDILPQTVMVDVKVTMKKEVQLVLNYTGQPAYDYYVDEDDISWEPHIVHVAGYREVMESYDVIYTENVDISGRDSSFDAPVPIKVPDGLWLVGTNNAVVHVGIKPYEYRTIEFSKDEIFVNQIYIDSNLDWTILNDKISMIVKGKAKDMEKIDEHDFAPQITLPIRDGYYKQPLQVNLPEGLTVVEFGFVELNVIMQKRVVVDRENIQIVNKNEEEYDYTINDLRATVTLTGPSEILESMDMEDLIFYVDVSDKTTGVHRLPVRLNNVNLRDVTLKTTTNVSVKVTPKVQSTTQQETTSSR